MANWCNLWLSVYGPADELLVFKKAAGRLAGRIHATKSRVFLRDMEFGEVKGGDLTAHRSRSFGRRFQRTTYTLQGRNDNYVDHFRKVSADYPALAFVLTFSDPNGDSHGSYLLLRGKRRSWTVRGRLRREIMEKAYRSWKCVDSRGRVDYDAEDADMADWSGFFDMMAVAERRWEGIVLKWLREQYPRRRRSR